MSDPNSLSEYEDKVENLVEQCEVVLDLIHDARKDLEEAEQILSKISL